MRRKRKHRRAVQLVLSVPTRRMDVARLSARQRALWELVRAESAGGVPMPAARAVRVAYEGSDGDVVVRDYADAVAALRRLADRGLVKEGPRRCFSAVVVGERRPPGMR